MAAQSENTPPLPPSRGDLLAGNAGLSRKISVACVTSVKIIAHTLGHLLVPSLNGALRGKNEFVDTSGHEKAHSGRTRQRT